MGYNWYRLTMKKSLITLLFMLFYIIVYGQETVGTFTMEYFPGESSKKVECTDPNKSDFSVYIGAVGEYPSDNINFIVKKKELDAFISSLTQIRDKFVEWEKVAKENKVTDVVREFDIPLPKLDVAWYGAQWLLEWYQKFIPKFFVFKDGSCAFVFIKTVTASSNQYIDKKVYFVLSSKEEFNELLSLLDIQKMKDVFSTKESKEDLFH